MADIIINNDKYDNCGDCADVCPMEVLILEDEKLTINEPDECSYCIFIAGLFYGLNGKVGKMIITWFVSVITLGIYALYIIYRSYKDETEFNNQMEYYILQRSKELKGKINSSELKLPESSVN